MVQEALIKSLWIEKEFAYDGSQLQPLYAYLNHQVLGDSIISWVGPCDIPFEHMKDGEDLNDKAAIRGSRMLHFIIEVFHQNLFSGVTLQRLFASIVRDYLQKRVGDQLKGQALIRDGDDIFWLDRKLSISIASVSSVSTQIHFAMNVSSEGTPVKTTCLADWGLEPAEVSRDLMKLFTQEFSSIVIATKKVRPLS